MSSLEQVACDDLKAFERRLTEIIASSHPTAIRWLVNKHYNTSQGFQFSFAILKINNYKQSVGGAGAGEVYCRWWSRA